MNVLITGGGGQLGKSLTKALQAANVNVFSYSKSELDISNMKEVKRAFQEAMPDYVFHTAAYTAVDECEKEIKKAFDINTVGTLNVAKESSRYGACLFYMSSDYVFDGESQTAYTEVSEPNPKSVYGLSKWIGERVVEASLSTFYIVRTSWLYGHDGKNFVKIMMRLGQTNKKIEVVNDQTGSPTYVVDLTKVLLQLIGKPYGIYHISNSGSCSWYEFATTIYLLSGADPELVNPTTTEEYGALAPRPVYSVLSMDRLEACGIQKPQYWLDAVKEFIEKEEWVDD